MKTEKTITTQQIFTKLNSNNNMKKTIQGKYEDIILAIVDMADTESRSDIQRCVQGVIMSLIEEITIELEKIKDGSECNFTAENISDLINKLNK